MAESLLLPVVRGVSSKAADALVQGITRMCGVDDDRRKLERQLLAVHRMLIDAEEKSETDAAVKRWMKDLKAVAYEADDVLEDFQYEALRREAQIGDSTTRKVLSYFTPHSPLLFRVTMSRKLSNVLKKINVLVMEMNTFGLAERAEAPQLPYRQTHSALPLDESAQIFGRDDDKEVVVKLLLDQRDEHKLQVLPVVGMGGLGKTTLAKMVYNDIRVQEHFQLKMWHCVSENFEAVSLLKSIIELATPTIKRCELSNTIEILRGKLQEVIGRKRFLLVLDDVWNEEEKKWEDDLKPLLSSAGGHGCVVVVTTRSQRVASIMGTLGPHEIACLNEDDSWELFSKRAFGKQVQEQAGRRIVKKCRGLPLALKTMGGLMSSKQLVSEWEAIAESNIGVRIQGKNDVLDILKLSYRHLPSEMKQCFAFCAVFPKDYDMEKDILIQLWMANGFIQEEETMDLEQKGEYIFHNLVWRSFLQDVKARAFSYGRFRTYESIGCKMHDLMHDLAKDVADECITSEQLIQQETSIKDVRHMYSGTNYSREIMGYLKGTSSLRTLIISPSWYEDLKELSLVSLRALRSSNDYFHHANLKQGINEKHLRHLDLSDCYFKTLPGSICVMYNLQTLRLNGCGGLKYLPEGMRTLKKLMHLYLLRCDSLERMPPHISLLSNLRTLTTFVLGTEAGRGIEELKDLYHLGNKLELYNLGKINSSKQGKEANLHQKDNLNELALYWGRDESYMPKNKAFNEEEVLESLTPHCRLKVLEIHGYSGLNIPQWMRDPQLLQCLRTLHISNCPGCKDLSTLWLSVSLEQLELSNMDNLTTLCKNVGVQIFPKIKYMRLNRLPNLEIWAEDTTGEANGLVTFPELEMLEIRHCPKLTSVPDCPALKKLETDFCCNLAMGSLTHLTTLSELIYRAKDFVCMSMPLGSWPSLVKLCVWSSGIMLTTREVETNQGLLEILSSFQLSGFNCFMAASSISNIYLGLWECFAFVEDVYIVGCDNFIGWPTSLIHLRSLCIERCKNFEGKGSSSEEIMSLSCLEKLEIRFCNSLLEIPKLPASLEDLNLDHCPRLVALPSNLGNLARLKILRLEYCLRLVALPSNLGNLARLKSLCLIECIRLKELPDGMDGLTSLEKLQISMCPEIEKFPQGLQRLPALEFLEIRGCASLQRRCREGGDYFYFLSSIPHIDIQGAETELKESRSNLKKLVKRLLPSC